MNMEGPFLRLVCPSGEPITCQDETLLRGREPVDLPRRMRLMIPTDQRLDLPQQRLGRGPSARAVFGVASI